MSFVFNGITIPQDSDSVYFNGALVSEIFMNGIQVWIRKAAAGSQVFTASGTFTVPIGVTELIVCMCGGGGGGSGYYSGAGGGGAGAIGFTIPVTPGSNMGVTIGAGGIGYSNNPGGAGGNSVFGGHTAIGAGGGGYNDDNTGAGGAKSYTGGNGVRQEGYNIAGGNATGCGGTISGGAGYISTSDGHGAPGGGGGFGVGANGKGKDTGGPYPGGPGGGGGSGQHRHSSKYVTNYGGVGGRGEVRISWA